MSTPTTFDDWAFGPLRSTTKVANHSSSRRFRLTPLHSLTMQFIVGNWASVSLARSYRVIGMRTGCPASSVEIRSQKSNCGVLEGSMTTTWVLAWRHTLRKIGGFSRPLLYQDCTIPQTCCQAQRCQRSDSDVDTSVSGMAAYLSGWRTSWAGQSIHIRLHHLLVFSGQFIQLMVVARIRPVELKMGDCLLHLQVRNDALSLALRAPLAIQQGARRSARC